MWPRLTWYWRRWCCWIQGASTLTLDVFWLPFIGGLVWSVSGFLAFTATSQIGMARAFGIWAPVNVVVSIIWGMLIFNEFLAANVQTLLLLAGALGLILAGVLLIIFAKGGKDRQPAANFFGMGLFSAIGAGVLWGSYFIPIKLASVSMWVAAFPLAVGIFVGSSLLVAPGAPAAAAGKRRGRAAGVRHRPAVGHWQLRHAAAGRAAWSGAGFHPFSALGGGQRPGGDLLAERPSRQVQGGNPDPDRVRAGDRWRDPFRKSKVE